MLAENSYKKLGYSRFRSMKVFTCTCVTFAGTSGFLKHMCPSSVEVSGKHTLMQFVGVFDGFGLSHVLSS
jgi:hypothetical protein